MATLRTISRAPLRQLCPRSSFAIATNHPRLSPRQLRGYASSAESQHKVCILDASKPCAALLIDAQLLSGSLEDIDPTVYKIIENVRRPKSSELDRSLPAFHYRRKTARSTS